MSFRELTEEDRAEADVRRAAQVERTERAQRMVGRLFMSDAEIHLRQQNHSECTRAGIVNQRQIRKHGDALVAKMKPVLDETNLSGPEILELRREMIRAPMSADESEKRKGTVIEDMRRPIYGTRKVVEAEVQATRAAAHASPALRKALHTGNASNSVGLTRALYRRVADGEPILRKPQTIIK
jgi:hypothetical protein